MTAYRVQVHGRPTPTYTIRAEDGAITYPGWDAPQPERWRVVGIAEARPFGRLREVPDWRAVLDAGAPTFANGTPRYHLIDFDHGSLRWWGAGITSAYRTEDTHA